MAGEEDVELRDLVAQSLEAKGVLGKIRAQLRANVFLALEEQESQEKPHPFVSEKLQDFQKTKEGKQALALVREFLEFFELDFTTAVFDPETNACDSYPGREQLARQLSLEHDCRPDSPLLSSLLRRSTHTHNPHTHSHLPTSASHPPLFGAAHSSLHPSSHHLPMHMATFPTSLTAHHHTSHPHITTATDRTHTITNGNSLPSISSADSALFRPHHPPSSASTFSDPIAVTTMPTTSVAMSTSAVTTTTGDITSVTSGITMTTNKGGALQSTPLTQVRQETDSLARSTGSGDILKDPSPIFSSSQPSSDHSLGSLSTGSDRKTKGGRGAGLSTVESNRQELDDFFNTSPPPFSDPPSPAQHPTGREESESSVSELLEEDSVGSGRTTDATQTENSLRGEYDFEAQITLKEQ